MDMTIFQRMDEDQLREYIAFFIKHYRVMDAFWFINIAEKFDQPTAEAINADVWGRVAGMAAKDLIARFGIREKGLAGFVKALNLFPWSIIVGYETDRRLTDLITEHRETIAAEILAVDLVSRLEQDYEYTEELTIGASTIIFGLSRSDKSE